MPSRLVTELTFRRNILRPASRSHSLVLLEIAYQLTSLNITCNLELHQHCYGNFKSPKYGRNWRDIISLEIEFNNVKLK